MFKISACFFLLLIVTHAYCQQRPQDALMSKTFGLRDDSKNKPRGNYYLIKADKPLISTNGIKLLRRLSYNHYIVSSKTQLNRDRYISDVTPANALWKADDNLINAYQKSPRKTVLINLARRSSGSTIISATELKLADLPEVLTDTSVISASLVRSPHTELAIDDIDLGENNIDAVADFYSGIDGAGLRVSVKEEQFDKEDLDLLGRTFKSIDLPENAAAHATIMATLIGGSGNSFIKGRGAAPEVQLTSSDFTRLLPDTISTFKNFGIGTQNHSYGTGIENYYGIEAEAYDRQIYENDTLVHVFSSGNIGNTAATTGVYAGIKNMANLSGTFKQAKNVLVVGGTGRTGVQEELSSAGPAYDGRIKPEIVADGEDGTSGAAALVTGTVALLKQAYFQKFKQPVPSALLKSILLNTADDIGTANVDYKTGFGRLNALEAVRNIDGGQFKAGSIAQDGTATYQVNVPVNSFSFKATLAWTDPAAELNAPAALVNDLDITITAPDGKIYLPWVLSSYPSADSLLAPAKRGRDSLNNVEQVTLLNPLEGTYTISVSAKHIVQGSQSFYIAYQTQLTNQFEWVSPTPQRQLILGEDAYFRWKNTFNTVNGVLSISYDKGQTWQQLSASVKLSDNYFKWTVPNIFSSARLKMQLGSNTFLSKDFVIAAPRTLQVGFNCTEGVLLHWNAQPGATGYNIYTIKDYGLQKLITVTDTNVLINPDKQTSKYYAVSAIGNGFEGIRSYTIDATAQGVGCYVKTLLAAPTGKSQITLTLDIGSTLNLRAITWQRLTGKDTYTTLGETAVTPAQLNYGFRDNNPQAGLNYYRAVLTKIDNSLIYSDPASAVLLQSDQFTMYPNPVSDQLNILSGDSKPYLLTLYDMAGKPAFNKTFTDFENHFVIPVLPGVYLGVITLNGKQLYKKKIVKL